MNAPLHNYSPRERMLDVRNREEVIAETLLPWPNLRASLDAQADAWDRDREIRSQAYFERKS